MKLFEKIAYIPLVEISTIAGLILYFGFGLSAIQSIAAAFVLMFTANIILTVIGGVVLAVKWLVGLAVKWLVGLAVFTYIAKKRGE